MGTGKRGEGIEEERNSRERDGEIEREGERGREKESTECVCACVRVGDNRGENVTVSEHAPGSPRGKRK